MDYFLNTLIKPSDNATHKDHRLEYGELSREDLDKLCEHKCENMVDIACGPARTLIYFYLNSDAIDMFGCEVDESRYNMGIENILKLRQYLADDGIRVRFTKRKDHVRLSSGKRTIVYCHMDMYIDLVKQKVSEAHIIIANVGYYYRMRHKYKAIFENIQPGVKIISYKGPKFVDDQYTAKNV